MSKVFISHAWEDSEISKKLAEYLRRDGAEVWIDTSRISGGDNLPEVIGKGIEWCDIFILIWSKSAKISSYVKAEWSCAFNIDKRIIPCLVEKEKLPVLLSHLLYIDIGNFEQGYYNLSKALNLISTEQREAVNLINGNTQIEEDSSNIAVHFGKHNNKALLRNKPLDLSESDVKNIIKRLEFYCKKSIIFGTSRYFNNQVKTQQINLKKIDNNGDIIVADYSSGLMWQQSGSLEVMTLTKSKHWIKDLNIRNFGSFNDWRMPTLEEAMSLMKSEKKNGIYLDNIFDIKQYRIWSSDKVKNKPHAWIIYYNFGFCCHQSVLNSEYVRAVRSI